MSQKHRTYRENNITLASLISAIAASVQASFLIIN
jgi:hypothetical protein